MTKKHDIIKEINNISVEDVEEKEVNQISVVIQVQKKEEE